MLTELIKIEKENINGKIIEAVNARLLHQFLESKQDFSTWIKARIDQYSFKENQDFILLHKIMEQMSGGKHLIEYYLTLNMAKELSMGQLLPPSQERLGRSLKSSS